MAAPLLIGYGSTLRGDDGAGYEAALRLGGLAVHQLTPELMEPISRAERVIFIDAAAAGTPGTISERTLAPAAARHFTHYATPEALLAGARELYGRCPEATLFTIAGDDFGIGQPLSAPVREALESLVAFLGRRSDNEVAPPHRGVL